MRLEGRLPSITLIRIGESQYCYVVFTDENGRSEDASCKGTMAPWADGVGPRGQESPESLLRIVFTTLSSIHASGKA